MAAPDLRHDYRMLFDAEYLQCIHLQGREHTVQISKVSGVTLVGEGGKKSKKPAVWFHGKDLPLALNRTNSKAVAGMYGNDTRAWVGKWITIYPTTTKFGRDVVDCIRVRGSVPQEPSGHQRSQQQRPPTSRPAAPDTAAATPTTDREPGSDG